MKRIVFTLVAGLALTAFIGCDPDRGLVTGKVTVDGVPLDNGTIQFYPVDGEGQTASAVIEKDGSYRVADVSPARMKVVVNSSKVVGKRVRYQGVADSPIDEICDEVLPARYSNLQKTELQFTVEPGANSQNFDLTSDKKGRK